MGRSASFVRVAMLVLASFAVSAVAAARSSDDAGWTPKRAPWGHPDLSELSVRAFRQTSPIVDPPSGRMPPLRHEGEAIRAAKRPRGESALPPVSCLVVERTSFIGKTGIGSNDNGVPTTPAIRPTERFTRVAEDRIDYELTVDDHRRYTAPFTIAMPLTTRPDYRALSYECHEGNHALANILSAARAEEAAAAAEE